MGKGISLFFSNGKFALKHMLRSLSLSQRVKATFIVSFTVFSALSLLVVFAASKSTEDYIFDKQLNRAVNEYIAQFNQENKAPLPMGMYAYASFTDIPQPIISYIEDHSLGTHELNHPNEEDFHYAIATMPNGERYYFVYDVNDVELSEKIERMVLQIILISFALFIFIFFIIFQLVLKRSLAPMFTLIEQVKESSNSPDNTFGDAYKYSDDEIGLLNRTLVEYAKRIEAFIKREREFTSFASHELRTPVTVIKGANDLLKLYIRQVPEMQKPLDRLERAVDSMEDMITVLLELAREEKVGQGELSNVHAVIEEILFAFQAQADKKSKRISVDIASEGTLNIPRVNGLIVMANLIRNAIQHSVTPDIYINFKDGRFMVCNAIDEKLINLKNAEFFSGIEQGYGLGKIIVERICRQQHWHYSQSVNNGRVCASVEFVSSINEDLCHQAKHD